MAEFNPGGATDLSHAVQKRIYERISSSDAAITLSTSTHRGKRLTLLTADADVEVPLSLASDFEVMIVSYSSFTVSYEVGVTFNNQAPATITVSPPELYLPAVLILDASPDYGPDDYLMFGSAIAVT